MEVENRIDSRLIKAKRIGSKYGLICVGLGLLFAQSIMMSLTLLEGDTGFINAFLWFKPGGLIFGIIAGITMFFISVYILGKIA